MNEPAQSANSDRFAVARLGIYLCGLATIIAGILDLIWGDFDAGHQPIGSLGVYIPGRAIFAYITGIWMILAGSAIFWRRTVRMGAWAMAIIYFIFGLFSLPRFYTMPHRYGFHVTLILGVFGEMLLQFIVAAGCVVLYASYAPPASRWAEKAPLVARWTFGLSGVLFGVGHLTNAKGLVHMIPKWMPFGAPFWILISGIGFLLAGLAILSGVLNALAARLLGLMLLIFEVALVPIILGYPHEHQAWGASAYNLAVAGAVLIFAASITSRHAQREQAIPSASGLA
jgi:uncharacterized membrane protein